jgi:hypothetical protein
VTSLPPNRSHFPIEPRTVDLVFSTWVLGTFKITPKLQPKSLFLDTQFYFIHL